MTEKLVAIIAVFAAASAFAASLRRQARRAIQTALSSQMGLAATMVGKPSYRTEAEAATDCKKK